MSTFILKEAITDTLTKFSFKTVHANVDIITSMTKSNVVKDGRYLSYIIATFTLYYLTIGFAPSI